ncbi:hypothetical protein SAMN05421858_1884 [Haladaptatus litoreus]|uniref:Uncharacterized protein n=1 Tax=Haladaptatus litoreus TaxID=553468 RepID=A0A1N6Z5P0_9EURY|nr:hypothetical protein [Haladaptatus litoreus]SIR22160.1 hypothetical protein SAMN05421858_1884 [Haladaptatus litoreus]
MASVETEHSGIMLGRNLALSKRLLGLAFLVFVLTFLAHTPPEVSPTSFIFGLDIRILALLVVVPALVAAYWNDGLLICLALAAAPALGFFLPLGLFNLVYPSSSVGMALLTGLAVALVFGVPAYVVGAGARWLVSWIRN